MSSTWCGLAWSGLAWWVGCTGCLTNCACTPSYHHVLDKVLPSPRPRLCLCLRVVPNKYFILLIFLAINRQTMPTTATTTASRAESVAIAGQSRLQVVPGPIRSRRALELIDKLKGERLHLPDKSELIPLLCCLAINSKARERERATESRDRSFCLLVCKGLCRFPTAHTKTKCQTDCDKDH